MKYWRKLMAGIVLVGALFVSNTMPAASAINFNPPPPPPPPPVPPACGPGGYGGSSGNCPQPPSSPTKPPIVVPPIGIKGG